MDRCIPPAIIVNVLSRNLVYVVCTEKLKLYDYTMIIGSCSFFPFLLYSTLSAHIVLVLMLHIKTAEKLVPNIYFS